MPIAGAEVAESRREAHQGPRAAARVLRLPGRALAASADHEPDRELIRDREAPHPGDQGRRVKDAAPAMAYKLLDAAQDRWRALNGAELVKELLDGATFKDGIKVAEDEHTTTGERVAAR